MYKFLFYIAIAMILSILSKLFGFGTVIIALLSILLVNDIWKND